MTKTKINTWTKNYKKGRFNKYPFDEVVSHSLNLFPQKEKRKIIKVLDLGCGGGNNTKFLNEEGFDVYGIDFSSESIKLTKKKLSNKRQRDKIIRSSFKNIPFKNNFFDFIIDRQSLGHNQLKDIEVYVNEIFRVTKKGGILLSFLFGDKHPHKKLGVKIKFKNSSPQDYLKFNSGVFKKSGVTHFFSFNSIKKLFKKFKVLDIIETKKKSLVKKNKSLQNTHSWTVLLKK